MTGSNHFLGIPSLGRGHLEHRRKHMNERPELRTVSKSLNDCLWVIPPDNGHASAEVRRALRRMTAYSQRKRGLQLSITHKSDLRQS